MHFSVPNIVLVAVLCCLIIALSLDLQEMQRVNATQLCTSSLRIVLFYGFI